MREYQSDWVVGMDLGDRQTHLCLLNTRTGEVREDRLRTTPKAFEKFFKTTESRLVAMEVGCQSLWASQVIEDLGHKVLLANPRNLHLISRSDSKNDRADAELLARMAAADPKLLSPITHRSRQTQADLIILKAREQLVGMRTALVNEVRGFLKPFGIRLPKCSTATLPKKAQHEIPRDLGPAIKPLLATIDSLSLRIKAYDKKITRLSESRYPQTTILRQVRGVGPITALAFALVIEDPKRFQKSRTVGAYLGLRPRQRESGSIHKQLRITKAGDRLLRTLLVHCAHYILGPFGEDCDLRRWGLALCQRGGKAAKKRAIVAVARKLSVVLHRLWMTRAPYEPLHKENKFSHEKMAG